VDVAYSEVTPRGVAGYICEVFVSSAVVQIDVSVVLLLSISVFFSNLLVISKW
jgi:hypothetical protein